MNGAPEGARSRLAERVYGLLLQAYPADFRAEYGADMLRAFAEWSGQLEHAGVRGAVVFWTAVLADLSVSAAREWLVWMRERLSSAQRPRGWAMKRLSSAGRPRARSVSPEPPYAAAALAGCVVWLLYAITLAPTTAFWDAGEYITVAHVLGIPHPPGNPLFVVLARTWELLLAPLDLPVAVRINFFSATLSAAAHALWFLVADRALLAGGEGRLFRRVGATAAVALSATAFTVWNQSTVNEKVYTVSLLTIALASWLAFRWRDTGRPPRLFLLVLYLVVLSAANHLMALLVLPALLVFALLVDRRALLRPGLWGASVLLVALALSAQFFLPIRAELRPLISEGEPTCESVAVAVQSVYTWGDGGCEALSSVLRREQYDKPPVTLDPTVYPRQKLPRGPALLASQLVNYGQYFDWQWGRSIAGHDPLFGGIRPLVTLLFLALGLAGARAHWRRDRPGAVYLGTLFLTLSVGLVLYLNFKYGYSIAVEHFPDSYQREVRERDYFFIVGFSVWGLWAGLGLASLWRRLSRALADHVRLPRLAATPVLALAVLPLALNWSWASRADDYTARDWAYNVLMSVDPYGVLVTNGDNDSFPLWYLQQVEGIRQDVAIVVSPFLKTAWYLEQLRELTTPCPPGVSPADDPTRIICQRPFRPEELPPALMAAGMGQSVRPPEDSIVPLSDAEIDAIASSYFVTQEPLVLQAGDIRTTIAAGTPMLPADTFVAAILQATLGERPIHFMALTPRITKLGLFDYTVRHGLTFKIHNGPVRADPDRRIVAMPRTAWSPVTGAYVDLERTDMLVWNLFLRRGRLLDVDAPWADGAVTIPGFYTSLHYAAARAHALLGERHAVQRHARRAEWWDRRMGG